MIVTYEGMACADCIAWIANGDVPEDRPALAADIKRVWGDAARHLVYSGGEDAEPSFSWSPCECCGSRLGGNHEPFAVLAEESV
jgi:hypothetical protein